MTLLVGLAACAFAVIVLRLAWSRERRSPGVNALAWGALAFGLVLLGWAHGAWGIAVGSIVAMLTAGALLASAALQSPGRKRAERETVAEPVPHAGGSLALGRRTAVFLLVVPGAFVAAILIAFALLGIARQSGLAEADALVLSFYAFPLAWTALILPLMFHESLRSAATLLAAISAGAGTLALVLT